MQAIDISIEELFDSPEHAGKIRFAVMDHTGDTKYMWNADSPDEVAVARSVFDNFTKPPSQGGKGYAAFLVTGKNGEKGEQVRSFEPGARAYIFSPPMVGG